MDKVFLTIIFTGISQTSLGSPILTCFDVDPTSTSTAQCFCHNPGGIGIIWHRDTTYLTQCTKSNEQCFTSTGYAFAVNSTTSTYTIDVESYSYTDCSSVSCSDSTTPTDSDLKTISVDDFNMNSTNLTIDEPSTSHTNGNISFTTDCLYKARTTNVIVTAKLTAVTEKGNHILEVDDSISEIGSCQSCSYDFASKFLIEFYHEEDQSKDKQKAHILIELFIDGNPVSSQNNMTNNVYYVRVNGGDGGFNFLWLLLLLLLLLIPFGFVIGYYCCPSCCKDRKSKRKAEVHGPKSKHTGKSKSKTEMHGSTSIQTGKSKSKTEMHGSTSIQTVTPKLTSVKPYAIHCEIEWTGSASEYKLEYRLEGNNWINHDINLNKTQTLLKSLHPDASYEIRVYAIHQSKVVEPPGEYQFTTQQILRIMTPKASAKECFVQWRVTDFPDENNELEYMLEYYLKNEEDSTKQCIIIEETQVCLKNLRPKTPYKIRLYAIYHSKVLEPPGESSFVTDKLHPNGHRPEADLSLSKHDLVSDLPDVKVTKKSAKNEPSSTCYDIEWTVENFDESRSKELRYMLEYILGEEDSGPKERILLSKKKFKFETLLPDKTYYIRVYAIYQSKVLKPPGKYKFRTQPMKSQPLASIDQSKENVH